ncbi:MAG: transglycosylase domain-containing protein, partial [SAR324 cluster bacterium]|nr:transglycosylase domain-containing protein [SAR324 cluster bacterium]
GRVVQGASTLTQQTSELLFEHKSRDRWKRWLAKISETIDAFRLELRYSKDQILEFYTNLFYVHGTGQGLSIAARYYFDKSVPELNLSEVSFIAGSVKGPNNYNPFLTNDPEKQKRIIAKATERRNYVLGNMLEMGSITPLQFKEASANPVQFRRGTFRFQQNHLLSTVKNRLETEPFKTILEEQGISDITRSELRITTTVDPVLQAAGEFEMKRHLSGLEYRFSPYKKPESNPVEPKTRLLSGEFYTGTIQSLDLKNPPEIRITAGSETVVVKDSLLREFVANVTHSAPASVNGYHYRKAFKVLRQGDPVLVSVFKRDSDGTRLGGIEQQPKLDGGLLVLQEGKVRVMVGGFSNKGFNRVLQARRQPGSTFKILLYLVALELGWDPLEPISNMPRPYQWHRQYYFPRPDHQPASNITSMVWAGAKSENLASIYLLENLLQYLDEDQFAQLMDFTDMSIRSDEAKNDYYARLRDKHGIIDTRRYLSEQMFLNALQKILTEFQLSEEENLQLRKLVYGTGWQSVDKRLEQKKTERAQQEQLLLRHNYLRFKPLLVNCRKHLAPIRTSLRENNSETLLLLEERMLEGWYVSPDEASPEDVPPLAYAEDPDSLDKRWIPLTVDKLRLYRQFWTHEQLLRMFEHSNIRLEGKISVNILQVINDLMNQRMEEVLKLPAYSQDRLFWHHDFRIALSLQTLIKVAELLGVNSELKPILSFPLGSNEVTLADLALLFQSYATGDVNLLPGQAKKNQWKIIERIEDKFGNVLFQEQSRRVNVLEQPTMNALHEIMRSVVEYGTGRGARKFLFTEIPSENGLKRFRIPAFGKTGTANNFTNSTYVGILPVIQNGNAVLKGGYVIAAYAGFDRLVDTLTSNYRLSGSSGALPIWARMARKIIQTPDYQQRLLQQFQSSSMETRLIPVDYALKIPQTVSMVNGMPTAPSNGTPQGKVHLPVNDKSERVIRGLKEMMWLKGQ